MKKEQFTKQIKNTDDYVQAFPWESLNDIRDSEECVSDTWLTLWNQIPPKKPNPFKAYICRIIKNLSLKRYEYHHAKKRNSQYDLSLEELEECISKEQNVENQIELRELKWLDCKIH